jgi:hypothetical protein
MTAEDLNELTKAQLIAQIVELDADADPKALDRLTKDALIEARLALEPKTEEPKQPTEKDLLIEELLEGDDTLERRALELLNVDELKALLPKEEDKPAEEPLDTTDPTDAEKIALLEAALSGLQTRADTADAALDSAQARIGELEAALDAALAPGETFELRPEELAIRRNIGAALKYAAENDPGASVAAIPILRALGDRIAA